MTDWIPVAERLPKCSRKHDSFGVAVIVYIPFKGSWGDRNVFEAYYGRRITRTAEFYLYGAILKHVTHWMPMPEPPKQARE